MGNKFIRNTDGFVANGDPNTAGKGKLIQYSLNKRIWNRLGSGFLKTQAVQTFDQDKSGNHYAQGSNNNTDRQNFCKAEGLTVEGKAFPALPLPGFAHSVMDIKGIIKPYG